MNRRGSDSNHCHNHYHSEERGQCRHDSNRLEPSVYITWKYNNEREGKGKRQLTTQKIKKDTINLDNFVCVRKKIAY